MFIHVVKALVAGCLLALSVTAAGAAEADMQKQIDEVRSALPKFAIPMREVGDRFQNNGINYMVKSEPGDVPK